MHFEQQLWLMSNTNQTFSVLVEESKKRSSVRKKEFRRLVVDEKIKKEDAKRRVLQLFPYPEYEHEFLKELISRERRSCATYFSHLGRKSVPLTENQRLLKRERDRESKNRRREVFKQGMEMVKRETNAGTISIRSLIN